jgi:hypothetical protein
LSLSQKFRSSKSEGKMNRTKSQPPKHGVIRVATMKVEHAKKHLAAMTDHAQIAADDGGHGIGQSSQGIFTGSGMSGGASGADYETTSVGSTPDADSTT